MGFSWLSCLSVLMVVALVSRSYGAEMKSQNIPSCDFVHVGPDTTIGQLLSHPALAGCARHMLARESDADRQGVTLRNIRTFLPYHSVIDIDTVVSSINHMIDDVGTGRKVFYHYYDEREKNADPSKQSTGLFFFRGKPGAPFAVICPGGGFSYVGSFHEGFPYAMELSKRGYNAFVLQYRVDGGGSSAVRDLAAALVFIFANADTLEVSSPGYSLWGSSAGARMAAHLGTHRTIESGGGVLPKPSTIVMAYTGHSEYSGDDPPTFVVVGENDGIAPPAVMERRARNLRNAGVDVEFHKYPNVGHGFGLGIGTSAEGWIDAAVAFWKKHH